MAFTKMTKSVKNVSMLPDTVQGQSNELKNTFDQAGVDLKDALNLLIDELGANTSAENLGALKDNIAITVQEYLDFMNAKLSTIQEGANAYTLPQATDKVLGGLKLGSTLQMDEDGVVNATGLPQPDLAAREDLQEHKNNNVRHITDTERIVWNTHVENEERHITDEERASWANKASSYKYNATIPIDGWSTTAPYTLEIDVEGITENDDPDISVVQSSTMATAQAQLEAWGNVNKIETGENKITCYCYESKPTTAIPILIKGVR